MPALLALLLITGLVTLWIEAPDLYQAEEGAAQATATTRSGILTVAAALIAASAAGAGLYFTARTIRLNQQLLLETHRASREADGRDRYAKSIDQLGHAEAPIRLGAMYSLERLAQDDSVLRQAVVDVLCAYLRMPFTPPKRYGLATESRAERMRDTPPPDVTDQESERNTVQELLVRQTAQRLLAAHLRRPPGTSPADAQAIRATPEVTFWPGISLDLTEANLVNVDLRETLVTHALFEGATFSGYAWFDGATFSGYAWFDGATFSGHAGFEGATFSGHAGFEGATFSGHAGFEEATFSGHAEFGGATFSGNAVFGGATFFRIAEFEEATFSANAVFGRAAFSEDARFEGATFSEDARFEGAAFFGNAVFRRAAFSEMIRFDGARFSGAPVLDQAQVLNVDDARLSKNRKWPDGWAVCSNADDPTRGTLVRLDSNP
ncbi:pentapeptide repeat-containing protein [Geodermatophilus sp. SYSU D00814]